MIPCKDCRWATFIKANPPYVECGIHRESAFIRGGYSNTPAKVLPSFSCPEGERMHVSYQVLVKAEDRTS